ncbi:MAG: hypothetical protein MUP97_07125 [Acidimicrobiia bacterium]|nr:hypothetical protein [Acidimicrobiia bacterium]
MRMFKGGPSARYGTIRRPIPGTFHWADPPKSKKDVAVWSTMIEDFLAAMPQAAALKSPPLDAVMLSEVGDVQRIENAIVEQFDGWVGNSIAADEAELRRWVESRFRLGWYVAHLEEASGLARLGKSETHYDFALGSIWSKTATPTEVIIPAGLAGDAGYFFGRSHDAAAMVSSIAHWEIDALRG